MIHLKNQIIKQSKSKWCCNHSVLYACKFLNHIYRYEIYPDEIKEENGLLRMEFLIPYGYEFIEFGLNHDCIVMKDAVFPENYARDIAEYSFLDLDEESQLLTELIKNLKLRINGEFGLD